MKGQHNIYSVKFNDGTTLTTGTIEELSAFLGIKRNALYGYMRKPRYNKTYERQIRIEKVINIRSYTYSVYLDGHFWAKGMRQELADKFGISPITLYGIYHSGTEKYSRALGQRIRVEREMEDENSGVVRCDEMQNC